MEPESGQQAPSRGQTPIRNAASSAIKNLAKKAIKEGVKRGAQALAQAANIAPGAGLAIGAGIEALDAARDPMAYAKKMIIIVSAIVISLIILIVLIVLVITQAGSGGGLPAGGGSTTASPTTPKCPTDPDKDLSWLSQESSSKLSSVAKYLKEFYPSKSDDELKSMLVKYYKDDTATPENPFSEPPIKPLDSLLVKGYLKKDSKDMEPLIAELKAGCKEPQPAPPSGDDCGGKWKSSIARNWMLPKNFGDPQCDYDPQKLEALLKEQDPAHAEWWFTKVIPCESGGSRNPLAWNNPNELNKEGKQTPDAGGAWGLYQMGSSAIAKSESPSLYCTKPNPCRRLDLTTNDFTQLAGVGGWGHGGVNDRSDVDWRTQTQYAINKLNSPLSRGKSGTDYWACAR